jgi:hypothetical protein
VVPDLVEIFDYRFSTRTPERIEAAFAHTLLPLATRTR